MSAQTPSTKIPSELFDEKSFYTLGGASAGVLLTCWAINFVLPHLPAEVFRIMALVLSEVIAVVIMLQSKNRKAIRWVLAFLNGLLIFANASGFNAMTASYSNKMNESDSLNKKATGLYFHFREYHSAPYQEAGIFPLPGMINWWPDEKLVAQNKQLLKKNGELTVANWKLEMIAEARPSGAASNIIFNSDSMNTLVKTLRAQLADNLRRQNELMTSLKSTGKTSEALTQCMRERGIKSDSLMLLLGNYTLIRERYDKLKMMYESTGQDKSAIKSQLDECSKQNTALNQKIDALTEQVRTLDARPACPTLTEHIKQYCSSNRTMRRRAGTQMTPDDYLLQQDFWSTFCSAFNGWSNPVK